ncbi:MAG: YigZ family protein [Eubacteriales bacterium]|nr:YigZ family protein [Eubacteriales bacterium]
MGIKIVFDGGEGEIIEKKSRFIATVKPVTTEEEALAFIAEMKKKYWNATHNCFAYVLGDRGELMRCSDDGEPQGTAGRPMLEVLLGEGVHDLVVVVTRYFGGTLLGTGGLVRAYSKAVQEGLKQSTIIEKTIGSRLVIETDYNGIGKLQYLFGQKGIPIVDSEYSDIVRLTVLTEKEQTEGLLKEITEATAGKAKWERTDDLQFAFIDREPLIFD